MKEMKAHPFLIMEDAIGERLSPLSESERLIDEYRLQELVRTHPDILPTAEIEPIFHPLISIGREVPVATGSIDNLFISHRGYLVLVETKLWRNPEAKREVVAQTIDYGSVISKWTYTDLDKVVRDYTRRFSDYEYSLIDWVVDQCGPVDGGKQFFEDTVAKNLRLGRFLTLIVGDKIRPTVVEMLGYIRKYPNLATDLALIELNCYRWETDSDWPLLIVPRIVARTEIVERSVIEVTVKQDGSVITDVRQEGGPQGPKPPPPTEEAFWELVTERASQTREIGRELIEYYRPNKAISIERNPASLGVWLNIQDSDRYTLLFYFSKDGTLGVPLHKIRNALKRARLSRDVLINYEKEVRRLLNRPSGVELWRMITEVDLKEFKGAVDAFISEVQAANREEEIEEPA